MGRKSRKLPGQPWKSASGIAEGLVENSATKWIVCVVGTNFGESGEDGVGIGVGVVTVVVKWGKVLMWASVFFLGGRC